MPISRVPALTVRAGAVDAVASAAPMPAFELAQAQLRALNHRLDAAAGDTRALEALIHADFVFTRRDGAWLSRAEFIADRQQRAAPAGATVDDAPVRLFGPVALLHGVFTSRAGSVRYTDVYLWSGAAWSLVSAQDSALGDGVPRMLIAAAAPVRPPWQGQDPQGDDSTVLTALNERYVDAFRRADVAWYDAHLAADYVVVSSDGSYRNRSAALAEFALPTFAEAMRSFPVDKVRVRLFGDTALIHASNVFALKDGRTGENRYTDIWQRQGGRWTCIAAHITTRKRPQAPQR